MATEPWSGAVQGKAVQCKRGGERSSEGRSQNKQRNLKRNQGWGLEWSRKGEGGAKKSFWAKLVKMGLLGGEGFDEEAWQN